MYIPHTQLFPTPVSLYGPCFIKVFSFFSPRNSATPVHRLCLVLQLPGLLMWVHAQRWADHHPSTYSAQNCKVEQHSKFAGRFSISFWHCRSGPIHLNHAELQHRTQCTGRRSAGLVQSAHNSALLVFFTPPPPPPRLSDSSNYIENPTIKVTPVKARFFSCQGIDASLASCSS